MCRLIILDDNIPFKGIFSAICKALNINYDVLTVRNHKGLLVEKFHHFINKAITIAVEDRGTNDAFIAARVATGYIYIIASLLMGPISFVVALLLDENFIFPSILI